MVTLHPCAICTSGLHCNVHLWMVLILSYDLHYLVQHCVAIAHIEGHHPSTKNSSALFSNGGSPLSTALEWFLPLLSTAQLPLNPFSLQNSQPVAPLPITHLSHTLWQSWGRRWWWCWGSQGSQCSGSVIEYLKQGHSSVGLPSLILPIFGLISVSCYCQHTNTKDMARQLFLQWWTIFTEPAAKKRKIGWKRDIWMTACWPLWQDHLSCNIKRYLRPFVMQIICRRLTFPSLVCSLLFTFSLTKLLSSAFLCDCFIFSFSWIDLV